MLPINGDPVVQELLRLRADVDALLRREQPNQALDTVSGPTFASLNVGATGAAAGNIKATQTDTGATTVPNSLTLGHNTSGTAAAGFGQALLFTLQDSTTADTNAAYDQIIWGTATHSSQKARRTLFVYDTAAREVLRLEASGSAAMIGFLGAAAVVRPTITGSRGGNAALASLLTALALLGLITDSTTA